MNLRQILEAASKVQGPEVWFIHKTELFQKFFVKHACHYTEKKKKKPYSNINLKKCSVDSEI